jgi:predicted Zn-dependent peptidase
VCRGAHLVQRPAPFFFLLLTTAQYSSGLEIVTVDGATPYSAATVTFRAGTRYEDALSRGAATQIARLLLGGNISGQTDVMVTRHLLQATTSAYARAQRETLSYAVEFQRDYQTTALQQLGQVVRPALRSWEVDDTRHSVEEEAEEAASEPESVIEAAHWTAFRGTPLAHVPRPLSVPAHSRLLQEYREHYMNRNNAVIVGVGVEHDSFVAQAETAFASLPKGRVAESPESVYVGGESHVESSSDPLFVLAFEAAAQSSRDYLTAGVLQEVLGRTPDRLFNKPRPGDGLSTRLNRRLAPEAGVLFAEAFLSGHSDASLFGVQVQALSGEEGNVLAAVIGELASLAKAPLSEAELNGAKLRYKHAVFHNAEPVDMRAHFLARQALFAPKVHCRADYVSQIDSITAKDLQMLVQKMLSGTPTLVSEGNSAKFPLVSQLTKHA